MPALPGKQSVCHWRHCGYIWRGVLLACVAILPISANDFASHFLAIQGGEGDVTLESIAITAPPNQVDYDAGTLFDPMGMSIWASFSNGYGLYVNHEDLVFDPARPLEAWMKSVTVSFSWGGAFQYYALGWHGAGVAG